MALMCARCGTQNPDTNKFCQNCGTPLTAPPPAPAMPVGATAASPFTAPPAAAAPAYAPPPPAATIPGPPPGAIPGPPPYASPYYAPGSGSGPQPGVHRTPWLLIVGVIVVLVVVMGGIGTVIAAALSNHSSQTAGFNSVSTPSPAVSPSAGQSPKPSAPPTTGGNVAANDGLSIVIPAGWTVADNTNDTITLESPNGDGAISIGSGPSVPPQSAQQNKASMDKFFVQQYPDTKPCTGSKVSNGPISGENGIFWELCFTLTSGAQTVQVGAPLWVGANPNGSVYYAALLETEASHMDAFIAECKPLLTGGITWKLK